jgi:hypothetical protein
MTAWQIVGMKQRQMRLTHTSTSFARRHFHGAFNCNRLTAQPAAANKTVTTLWKVMGKNAGFGSIVATEMKKGGLSFNCREEQIAITNHINAVKYIFVTF